LAVRETVELECVRGNRGDYNGSNQAAGRVTPRLCGRENISEQGNANGGARRRRRRRTVGVGVTKRHQHPSALQTAVVFGGSSRVPVQSKVGRFPDILGNVVGSVGCGFALLAIDVVRVTRHV